MSISEYNKLDVITNLVKGQRVIRVNGQYFPVGAGSVKASGTISGGSSAIFRCIEVGSDNFYTPVGAIGIEYPGLAPNPNYIGEAYSLAGVYVLVDQSATGAERVWECRATNKQTIDGVEYEPCYARMYYVEGGDSYDLKIDAQRLSHPGETGVTVYGNHMVGMGIVEPGQAGTGWTVVGKVAVAPSFVGGDALWKGEKLSFVDKTWQGTGEIGENLVAVGYTPEVGKAYTVDTGALATLYPEEPSVSSTGAPSVAKVTDYIPYSPAFSGITEVNVSGLGRVGEEDWGEDYSDANGKYIVTDATYYETDENKRVYKHETKNYWLMCYDDTENYWYDGCIYWLITEYETDSDPYSSIVCVAEDTLPVGMSEWYNYNYDTPVDVGTATTHTDKPEQPLVLKGQMASAYDFSDYGWIFPETITDFSGFDVEPKNGELFSVVDGRLIGGTLGFNPAEMEGNAVVYSNYGNSTGAVPQGIVLPYSRKTVVSGVPCVWFDTDAASDGIGTRESWAYLPLSKTLNFYSEQAQTQPVPFNTFSIIGTMFCETWGNTGSGGFRVTNKLDLSSYGERPSWDGIGVHFDPNYGFTIAGGWGHPSDYKKYYNAYNGKWAQFALIVDGYTAKLYINGELRVEACNFDYGSSNPAEIKYLCFRQPNDLYSTVYFGKMYVFDRVLSNSEIARAYKTLQSMELPPFTGLPDGYKFRASFSNSVSAETGQALSVTGNPEITTKNGVPCAYFDGTVEISTQLDIDRWTDGVSHIAISAWIKIDPAQYENIRSICGFGQAGYHLDFSKDNDYCSSEWMHILMRSSYGKIITDDPNLAASHRSEIWINGSKTSEMSPAAWGMLLNTFGIGNYLNSGKERFTGHIAEVIVYNRALRDSEIKQLAAQYAKKTVAGGEDEW